MNTEIIFELAKLGRIESIKKNDYASVLMSSDKNQIGVSIGSPAIVRQAQLKKDDSQKITIVFPFPIMRGGMIPNHVATSRVRHVMVKEDCFLKQHAVKDLVHFNSRKLRKIQEYVDAYGSISFNIGANNPAGKHKYTAGSFALKFIENLLEISEQYTYNSLQYNAINDGYKIDSNNMVFILTFLSLSNCVAIFNPKKLDGMGMIFSIAQKKESFESGTLSSVAKIAMLYSNHLDNLFVVDGVTISEVDPLHKDTVGRLASFITANADSKPKNKGKKKSSKDDVLRFIGTGSGGTSNSTSSGYYSNTTASYYTIG